MNTVFYLASSAWSECPKKRQNKTESQANNLAWKMGSTGGQSSKPDLSSDRASPIQIASLFKDPGSQEREQPPIWITSRIFFFISINTDISKPMCSPIIVWPSESKNDMIQSYVLHLKNGDQSPFSILFQVMILQCSCCL